jgi:hypothetical protein
MSKLNAEAMKTFPDGSELLISTHRSGDGTFACELFLSRPCAEDIADLRTVSNVFEASTCRQAQDSAYHHACQLYSTGGIKTPPYLIWTGPHIGVEPHSWGRGSRRR